MKTLDVVCPVFNEAEVIGSFYQEISKQFAKLADRYSCRVIFVLDQSPDNTEEILTKICREDKRVVLISLSSRFGHQMSLVAGLDHSTADYCIMMDCDLEHPPSVIPELLAKAEEGYDIVYTVRNYSEKVSYFKRTTSSLYYRFINLMTDLTLEDGSADFRLLTGKVRDVFKYSIREQNQFLRGLTSWIGFRSVAVRYTSNARAAGTSKFHFSRLIQFAAVGIISFSKKPLRLAVYLGFFVSGISVLSVIFHIYNWARYSDVPPGWTTTVLLVSFIGGAQLFFLGILGEYLGFIFDEVKGRPLYIVDKKING